RARARRRARPMSAQDVPSSDPGACSRIRRGMDAPATAVARVCFLWLLSFAQAKESDWSPWMATKPHTDVSRFSRKTKRSKRKSKWIPASAGMTNKKRDPGLRRDDKRGAGSRPTPGRRNVMADRRRQPAIKSKTTLGGRRKTPYHLDLRPGGRPT